jgi:hypothetical protein
MIRKVDEEIYRNEFISGLTLDLISPAVDGLYIFPDPQWRDGGNGFMEVLISAYGRSNTIGKTEIPAIVKRANVVTITGPNYINSQQEVIASYLRIKLVVPSGTLPEINLTELKDLITVRNEEGTPLVYQTYTTEVLFNLAITRYDITNFGFWDELTITVEPPFIQIAKTLIS